MIGITLRTIRGKLLLTALLAAMIVLGGAGQTAAETQPKLGSISGTAYVLVGQTVVDGIVTAEEENPVAEGMLAIPELDVSVAIGPDGSFSVSDLPVNADPADVTEVTVIITAPGSGSFTYNNLRIGPGYRPILSAQLTQDPRVDDVVYPDLDSDIPQEQALLHEHSTINQGGSVASGSICPASREPLVLPPTIRVWENGSGQDNAVHSVDFKSYTKHVLPREWPADWDPNALGAGAVAVKSYAWWHATHAHHKPNPSSACYDVDATVTHQVYDPFHSDDYTDDAVDDTWNYFMVLDDGLDSDIVQAFYKQGLDDECGEWTGPPPSTPHAPAPGDDMSQYGSQACALDSLPWYYILPTYYFSPAVDWLLRYTGDDSDGDLCTNGKESGIDQKFGGRRNLHNQYDYFNPTQDRRNRIDDVLAVVGQ